MGFRVFKGMFRIHLGPKGPSPSLYVILILFFGGARFKEHIGVGGLGCRL